ncbi:hypothetical protein JY651_07980 [Pyxidicoccus parkwayensis]|uniref:DUF2622 domain-containing protein n=1 Tax=Pyxidicoccus parkwayensis TaxID=2813578 RepID=A0ABX7P332_9BACT|nr:hypothetical protein [Pyxidicoccus parkwaysis]QSQ24868.1 hypothetical protein JY651_07980 [Pyxidicoccus parkwaysis]
MPLYIVAYDVKTPHQKAVKDKLLANGFSNRIPVGGGGFRQLPDTTVAVNAGSSKEAFERFHSLATSAVQSAGVVERAVAVGASDYWMTGESSN